MPPKNVNFGNESLNLDTTSQSSHKITSTSTASSIILNTSTVTFTESSLPSGTRKGDVQGQENGQKEKLEGDLILPSSEAPSSSSSESSLLLPSSTSSEGKSTGYFLNFSSE